MFFPLLAVFKSNKNHVNVFFCLQIRSKTYCFNNMVIILVYSNKRSRYFCNNTNEWYLLSHLEGCVYELIDSSWQTVCDSQGKANT